MGDWTDYIKPVLGTVGDILGTSNRNSGRGDYFDALRQGEDRNYQDTINYNNAYADYVNRASAAAASSRASSAAAAAQTQKNKQKAAKKGLKSDKKFAQKQLDIYSPYLNAGKQLLPVMQNTYNQGAGNLGMLNAYLSSPGQLAKLNQATLNNNIQLPEYLMGGK